MSSTAAAALERHPRAVPWRMSVGDYDPVAELTTASFSRQDARNFKAVQAGSSSSWWSVAELAVNSG
ncbi:hypothetical protein [Micromonospora fulviviridis]|uniref:Uncharacterized protein n=1 Tax=Micromonospora fulviviridis TaxID=47860 RepID=A0ABV2VT31_9ACTN